MSDRGLNYMEQSEIALVRRAQAGDTRAFDRLAIQHEERLLGAIFSVLGNAPDAYDAYQETLVRVYRSLGSFRFESALSTWMTRIALRQALNWKRRWKADRYSDLEQVAEVSGSEQSDQAAETSDARRALAAAMERLSKQERAAFMLKHEQHYKIREIAEMMDCAEGTIKSYLFRAVRKLREGLPAELRTP